MVPEQFLAQLALRIVLIALVGGSEAVEGVVLDAGVLAVTIEVLFELLLAVVDHGVVADGPLVVPEALLRLLGRLVLLLLPLLHIPQLLLLRKHILILPVFGDLEVLRRIDVVVAEF
mmetsp:Transcript_22930/g.22239  ORF Transcript_22930/g.22239 Transcript_22930/m.22239 type:complete len:117 (-) Transcript_22930:861-1211(-)